MAIAAFLSIGSAILLSCLLRLFEFAKPGVCVAAANCIALFRAYSRHQFERAGSERARWVAVRAVEFA